MESWCQTMSSHFWKWSDTLSDHFPKVSVKECKDTSDHVATWQYLVSIPGSWYHPSLIHTYTNVSIVSEKQKLFRDGLSYSTPQKS